MRSLRHWLILTCWIVCASVLIAAEKEVEGIASKPDRADLEKRFEEMLSGVVLVGNWTVDGKSSSPKPERYTITKVTKATGDHWFFSARLQYADQDLNLPPFPLEVKWAGDTPVITLTDLTIPGMGTFSSRVLFFRGSYAGTWQHGEAGGHLWGRVEKLK